MQTLVCSSGSNFPNPPRVQMRLYEHGKNAPLLKSNAGGRHLYFNTSNLISWFAYNNYNIPSSSLVPKVRDAFACHRQIKTSKEIVSGEPALVSAVALSMQAKKLLLNLNVCAQSNRYQCFLVPVFDLVQSVAHKSPIENARALVTAFPSLVLVLNRI